jgi:Na+-driven multidrug efflux pump
MISFFASVTAIQVSKESALGNQEGVQEAIWRAIFVGAIFSAIGSVFMLGYTDRALSSVLKGRKSNRLACALFSLGWPLTAARLCLYKLC